MPSWSWMAYSGGIDFIRTRGSLKVPRYVDFGFSNNRKALDVKVRRFGGNCRMEQKEEEYIIFSGTEEVGSCWFDVAGRTEFEYCVVVGVDENDWEGAWKTYYIFVVGKKDGSGRYKRLGVGKVEAQYVSIACDAGTLW